MAGHSKWANIKHRKEKSDAKKGKIFTKIGREIAVAVKQGGPDPQSNTKLRDAIAKAKANNMPNDSIARSIKKAAGDTGGQNYEEVIYEGYGPEGVALIIEAMTDNRNRTAGEIRHIFDKYGGNLGSSGCVSFLFSRKGVIIIEKTGDVDEEEVVLEAIDAGAEDVEVADEYIEITTDPSNFSSVSEKLGKYKFESAGIELVPANYVKVRDDKHAGTLETLIDMLEDNDDVQNVYHNWDRE
jgi:YebC/PmpR family DNA-binding regulatory protein